MKKKWKPTVDINVFHNYAAHSLRLQNTRNGEPELKNIWEKSQDKNDLIFHNTIIYEIWNQISDIIHWFGPFFQDSENSANGGNSNPYLAWKIRISMYLFKRVENDMSGFLLRKQVTIMLQYLTSMIVLITVSWMLKARYVALFRYLAL